MKLTVNSGCKTTDAMISALVQRQRISENVSLYVGSDGAYTEDGASHVILLYKNDAYLKSERHLSLEQSFGTRYAALALPLSLHDFEEKLAKLVSQATNIPEVSSPLAYDKGSRTVSCEGKSAVLSAKESKLFEYLLSNKGRFISREELRSKLWQNTDNTNAPDVYVSYLRRKLRDVLGEGVIVNVRGKGYIFSANE